MRLQKGGIYRDFESKEQIALVAFDYAQQQSTMRLIEAVAAETDPIRQLLASNSAFHALTINPPAPGGCPMPHFLTVWLPIELLTEMGITLILSVLSSAAVLSVSIL